jgi:hypothetical protein
MDESALRSALASLDDCNSSLHWWLGFWTLLVVIGVVLEVFFVVWEYWEELHDFRRGIIHAPERPNIALFIFGLFGAGLVAAGVAGELWEESRIATVETCIRKGNDALFLLLSKEAGDAETSAKGAARAASEASASADTLKKYLAQLATPREIVISDRDGDHEERAVRFSEVRKYPGTVALIQWIPEFESSTYALHLAAALNDCGWHVKPTTPEQSHIPYEWMQEGVRVITLEESLLEPGDPSSARLKRPIPPKSAAFAPAAALVKLLDLDLGPPYGPAYFGVHWEPEWNDSRFTSLTKRGFVFPNGTVLILVGTQPKEYAHMQKKKKQHNAKP